MARRDYYQVLGVGRDAPAEEIKKAYRRLAMECHPDRKPGDAEAEERFKEASEAYSVLSDPDRRARYDTYGHAGMNGAAGPATAGGFADVFADLFSDFFGGRGAATSSGRGDDLRYRLRLTLEEAAAGVERSITYPRQEECERCLGDGQEPGHKPVTCKTCQGRGEVRFQQAFFTMARTCPHCGGRGKMVEHPCKGCRGEGRVRKERTLAVNIPAGVREGTRLRLRGEGDGGLHGGEKGDLFVVTEIEEHPLFGRDGDHLILDLPLRLDTAVLGGEVEVPTLEGPTPFKIPEGTQPGQVFQLKGKGMPRLQASGRGDLFLRVLVEVPRKLGRKQREAMRTLGEELGESSFPQVREHQRKVEKAAQRRK